MNHRGRHRRWLVEAEWLVAVSVSLWAMTYVPERVNELRDGVIRPFNATTEGNRGPYRESGYNRVTRSGAKRPGLTKSGPLRLR